MESWKCTNFKQPTKGSLGKVYFFHNGITGNGTDGFQNDIFSNTPAQKDQYTPLRTIIDVTWNIGKVPEILDSEKKILMQT